MYVVKIPSSIFPERSTYISDIKQNGDIVESFWKSKAMLFTSEFQAIEIASQYKVQTGIEALVEKA